MRITRNRAVARVEAIAILDAGNTDDVSAQVLLINHQTKEHSILWYFLSY